MPGGTVLYVGKAAQPAQPRSVPISSNRAGSTPRPGSLAREIADLETIGGWQRARSAGARAQLIKQYRPKFNVLLRDDKTYPYIKFTAAEKYPRVCTHARIKKDGSLYFGPYFPSSLARRILHFVHKRFLVPVLHRGSDAQSSAACLQYYIKRGLGPACRADDGRSLCGSRARCAVVSRKGAGTI